jgi:hypothetical protein
MAGTSMLMKSESASSSPNTSYQECKVHGLTAVSSPADVIWSSLLNDKPALHQFISTNRERLTEAHAFMRAWFKDRGFHVAPSNA